MYNQPQTPTKERNSKTQESKLSLLTKTALTLGTIAVVNISYSPIKNYLNHTEQIKSAQASSISDLTESAEEDVNKAINGSYPLWRACDLDNIPKKDWGKELEKCGKGMRWTQEEIDFENEQNRNMFAMLFLFWLDIGGGSPKPSASQIDSLATQVSKTPKQSATFKSSTGERVTLRSKPGGTTLDAEIRTSNGKTIRKSEPVNRNKPRNAEETTPNRSNPRELEAPCLSANPDNSNTLNIVSNNLTPREKLASLLEKIRTRSFDSMLGVESVEAKSCYDGWKNARENIKQIESESGEMLGSKGVDTKSSTIGKYAEIKSNGYKVWRVDIENPSPGVRPGQIHIQPNVPRGQYAPKYYFSPIDKALYEITENGLVRASESVQNLLGNTTIQKNINNGLSQLGENLIQF